MSACADVYKLVTDIQEYLHKMFKSIHMQVIVIEINAFSIDFTYQLSFWDSERICFNNEIIMCCYVCYILKYALKSADRH